MKVALLGGSFDPIHKAHIQMAVAAKSQLHVDEVWFVPAKDTPLKERTLSNYESRLRMCELAIHNYRHFKICTIEKTMSGKSYTIHTIRKLKEQYPDIEFYFLIGNDQVKQLKDWYLVEELVKEVSIAAFARNGEITTSEYPIHYLAMNAMVESSTAVRNGAFYYLPCAVRNYVLQKGLYFSFLETVMSTYRYRHSVSVAKLCVEIAQAQGLDIHKAWLCGMLHDINKEFRIIDEKEAKIILREMKPELLAYPKGVWHGFIGSFICSHRLGIKDQDIIIAIENHVLGECRNRYAMLLYACDKLDPLRDYDTSIGISLCKKNLYEGYRYVVKEQDKYYGEESARGK